MRLKLFFLGMLAAAAMISCNNDVIGPDNGPGGGLPPEGIPVHASFNFKISSETKARTYAGTDTVIASSQENAYTDAAMYLYKWDGVIMTPEAYLYVPNMTSPTDYQGKITLRATSGLKKVFVALNLAQGTDRLVPTPGGSVPPVFNALNNVLYAGASDTWDLTVDANNLIKADGLIRALAKGDIYSSKPDDGTYSGTYPMLMTNWDGPEDVAILSPVSTWESNCVITLQPNIDSLDSRAATATALENFFDINVQRAFAKISLGITVGTNNTYTFTDNTNLSDPTDYLYVAGLGTYQGLFQPWSDADEGDPIWSLGNIHKETLPFQQFVSGLVRDHNYDAIDDSIIHYAKWTERFDNTRIFPFGLFTINTYPHDSILVDRVKDRMLAANNWQYLSDLGAGDYNFAYATENARRHININDWTTYAIIGGRYNPEQIITSIVRANLASQLPTVTTATGYSYEVALTDTMYYIPEFSVFVLGKLNVYKYLAYVVGLQKDADPDGDFGAIVPWNPVAIVGYVNDLLKLKSDGSKGLYGYVGGQCWYRIFLEDPGSDKYDEKRVVRRNHIYSINITSILGPGIDDPNNILIPGKDDDESDTYVTANIKILDWHQVNQNAVVSLN